MLENRRQHRDGLDGFAAALGFEAFDAADRTPLSPERLKTLPAEKWPLVRLELSPSLQVIDAAAPVHEVWAAATGGREIPSIAMRRTVLRIWRHDLRVFHRVMIQGPTLPANAGRWPSADDDAPRTMVTKEGVAEVVGEFTTDLWSRIPTLIG